MTEMIKFVDLDEEKYNSAKLTHYDKKVMLVDLEAVWDDPIKMAILAGIIRSDYNRVYQRVRTSLSKKRYDESEFQFGEGLIARQCVINRDGWIQASNNIFRIDYKGENYNFTIRHKFYTDEHYVVSKVLEQTISKADQIELFLHIIRILGESHEGFYNQSDPSLKSFHAQFIKRKTTIWDDKKNRWPTFFEEIKERNISQASNKVFSIIKAYRPKDIACDLIFRYMKDEYRIILIPRNLKTATPNFLIKRFGTLEMAGFLPMDVTDIALRSSLEKFFENPGFYIDALNAFSINQTD